MGWIFTLCTRERLINDLISPRMTDASITEVIVYEVQPKLLWKVVRRTARYDGVFGLKAGESKCHIVCEVLERNGNEWGHLELTEDWQPTYYTCPLHFLDMTPTISPEWRARVHEHALKRA